MKVRVEKQIGRQVLAFETGWLAKQADATVIAQYGDNMVLAAVTSGPPRSAGQDFFPLTVDYRERVAAAGKFPGGFIKREGRPSTKETLTSRLIDRPVRPLFPDGFVDEVQIQCMVLSSDRQQDADLIAMNGAAAALFISPLPFRGPIAAVRLARVDGQWVPFPNAEDLESSDLDLVLAGSESAVMMIEGFAREMPEDDMLSAIFYAHDVIKEICALQRELYQKVGVQRPEWVAPPASDLLDRLKARFTDEFRAAKQTVGKQNRSDAVKALKEKAIAEFIPDPLAADAIDSVAFDRAWDNLAYRVIRDLILAGTRPDGRDSKTIRDIECTVDVLPRTHGSAVFQRGETQALITIVLGTAKDEQRVDGLLEEYSKKFMLDYNFPPFSVGECKPIRGPGRREIGHGALAERSVKPVVPSPEDFPYTIRVVSDILESNGSSSMASVCGATLGLMAAGVPITNPVAGISIGLVKESEDRWVTLTDIIGDEDHFGDMDFKVAGTQNGITGIQLDLKIDGISEAIIRKTLTQAREARIEILRKILTTIREPRSEVSQWAPRLLQTKIEVDKIGLLIGPGGKTVRGIQESTGAVIEIAEDGMVTIASNNREWAEKALAQVEALTASVQIGKIYDGKVASIKDFGAFVEILPGRDGLCHISELSNGFVNSVADVCKVGDDMKVLVIDIDEHDRVKLSRRRALEQLGIADDLATGEPREGGGGGGSGGGGGGREPRPDRGGDRGDRRGGRPRNGDGHRRDRDRERR